MLINGKSRLLKNDETNFNGTTICTFLKSLYAFAHAPPASDVNPDNKSALYLKKVEGVLPVLLTPTKGSPLRTCSSLLN